MVHLQLRLRSDWDWVVYCWIGCGTIFRAIVTVPTLKKAIESFELVIFAPFWHVIVWSAYEGLQESQSSTHLLGAYEVFHCILSLIYFAALFAISCLVCLSKTLLCSTVGRPVDSRSSYAGLCCPTSERHFRVGRSPLYFQHQGHSRTIIGKLLHLIQYCQLLLWYMYCFVICRVIE